MVFSETIIKNKANGTSEARVMKSYIRMLKDIIDKKSLKLLIIIIFFLVFAGVVDPIITWIYKLIIDCIGDFANIRWNMIIWIVIAYEVFQCILQIINYIKDHLLLKISYKLNRNILVTIHNKVKNIAIEKLEKQDTYDLLERINTNVTDDAISALMTVFQVFTSVIAILLYCFMLSDLQIYFPVIILIGTLPSIVTKKQKSKERFYLAKILFANERRKNYFLNVIFQRECVKDVKLLRLENYFLSKAASNNDKILAENTRVSYKYLLYETLANVVRFGVFGVCVYITCGLVIQHEKGLGSIMLAVNTFQLFTQEVENLTNLLKEIHNMNWLMEEWEEFKTLKEKVWGNKKITDYNIEFKNVIYKYPNAEINSLDGVSVKIREGEKVLIVGENGSGKSTFVNLLMGMYSVEKGEIKIGGVHIDDISKASMNKIICVFQNFIKYSGSVKENITLGDSDIEINKSIVQALGLQTLVKDNIELGQLEELGSELSGGQWQKLAICRAAVRNSSILIMDEPTASLDPKSENKLYEELAKICSDKTLLLISHRLSACKVCDRILTFSQGKVIENGTFEELMKLKGKFYDLYSAQREYYE